MESAMIPPSRDARDERILHAFAAQRDAVGDGDGVESDGLAAACVRALLGFEREFINVHVARRDIAPSGRDADDGLLEICFREADGIKHGARGGPFRSVHENARERTHGIRFTVRALLFHQGDTLPKKCRRGKAKEFNAKIFNRETPEPREMNWHNRTRGTQKLQPLIDSDDP